MKGRRIAFVFLFVVLLVVVHSQITFFVVQPIGAVPEGRTIVIWRTGRLKFIDSADGVCARETGVVNLLCRGAVLGALVETNTILLRLPYSETLYLVSTGGIVYDR